MSPLRTKSYRINNWLLVLLLGPGAVVSYASAADALLLSGSLPSVTHLQPGTSTYEGCAPARSVHDAGALRIATVRAQANLSRTRNLTVGGTERLIATPSGDQYQRAIGELSAGFQHPVEVVEQRLMRAGDEILLCVVIVEKPHG